MLAPSEYDLQIDSQVEKFLETKQKLTYFLITASAAVIAFLFNFVHDNKGESEPFTVLVLLSCLSGIVCIGCALLNIRYELKSYRLHLKSRYERKDYSSLDATGQYKWDEVNRKASLSLERAFEFLYMQMVVATVFFVRVFLQ